MIRDYKHVIWDWNGTILDDAELCVKIVNKLKISRGLEPVTIETYRSLFGFPVRDYYSAIGFDLSEEPFEKLGREWMDEYEREKYVCRLRAGVKDVLEAVSGMGIGQSILSAYSQDYLEETVRHYGLGRYFARVCGLDTIYAPSKTGMGMRLMAELGHGEGETLMIGDTIHDFETAKIIGADCVLLEGGHQDQKRLAATGARLLADAPSLLIPPEIN